MKPGSKEDKREVALAGFEMFKNGIFNYRSPHDYNWCMGYTTPPPNQEYEAEKAKSKEYGFQKINGQHISA